MQEEDRTLNLNPHGPSTFTLAPFTTKNHVTSGKFTIWSINLAYNSYIVTDDKEVIACGQETERNINILL